jgi:hypothetical protein
MVKELLKKDFYLNERFKIQQSIRPINNHGRFNDVNQCWRYYNNELFLRLKFLILAIRLHIVLLKTEWDFYFLSKFISVY